MYNYRDNIMNDVIRHIAGNYSINDILDALDDINNFAERLSNDCWVDDAVTGNASGSYTFNQADAREYVLENMAILFDALDNFGAEDAEIVKHLKAEDYEYFDVTIRCYLLPEIIAYVMDFLGRARSAIAEAAEHQRYITAEELSALIA